MVKPEHVALYSALLKIEVVVKPESVISTEEKTLRKTNAEHRHKLATSAYHTQISESKISHMLAKNKDTSAADRQAREFVDRLDQPRADAIIEQPHDAAKLAAFEIVAHDKKLYLAADMRYLFYHVYDVHQINIFWGHMTELHWVNKSKRVIYNQRPSWAPAWQPFIEYCCRYFCDQLLAIITRDSVLCGYPDETMRSVCQHVVALGSVFYKTACAAPTTLEHIIPEIIDTNTLFNVLM